MRRRYIKKIRNMYAVLYREGGREGWTRKREGGQEGSEGCRVSLPMASPSLF